MCFRALITKELAPRRRGRVAAQVRLEAKTGWGIHIRKILRTAVSKNCREWGQAVEKVVAGLADGPETGPNTTKTGKHP
jgi:hypothetical protein